MSKNRRETLGDFIYSINRKQYNELMLRCKFDKREAINEILRGLNVPKIFKITETLSKDGKTKTLSIIDKGYVFNAKLFVYEN
jgi:hypothetical protein